jgi:hypothetical protein
MMLGIVFWVVLPCKIFRDEAVLTPETSVDNYFTRQYIPEDNSEQSQEGFLSPLIQQENCSWSDVREMLDSPGIGYHVSLDTIKMNR